MIPINFYSATSTIFPKRKHYLYMLMALIHSSIRKNKLKYFPYLLSKIVANFIENQTGPMVTNIYLSEYCSQQEYGHPQAAFPRRSISAGPVEYLTTFTPENLSLQILIDQQI